VNICRRDHISSEDIRKNYWQLVLWMA